MSHQQIHQYEMSNGMTLLIEHLPAVRSAAVTLTFPAGTSHEPAGKNGIAALLSELMLRGAGDLDSRQLSIAFDNLGVQYSVSPGWFHLTISAATIAERLPEALELIAKVLLEPRMEANHFDMCKVGREQALRSIEDEPRQKLMIELRRRCYPPPWNRPLEGTMEHLDSITLENVTDHYRRCCVPEGAILGIAGYVDPQTTRALCEQLFGGWQGIAPKPLTEIEPKVHQGHLKHDSTQTNIGIAYPAVPYNHPDYYSGWAAVGILSGGMSSRLFTKVREERGLCYAIGASLNTLKDRARVLCYAGTTNERAQETLDVTLNELKNFGLDITENELQRCKARAKSSLIMQEESTMARAGSMVRDWFHLGEIKTLDEVRQKVDSLTIDDLTRYAEEHSAEKFQVLTIGPEPLDVHGEVDISDL
ncbi:pitrilysin family protein [uncultured Rubinisphaera sp.]|uniref:M16 family metallopeptidase n=1 Tax=uncultured Rubinisphaera sp. TaxID=1678686 RepID=UPI0030DBD0D0|tara:strand:- start:3872 stop:5131 length:1260 start_codon:yes stop_codon:yes gene_type:complete